MNSKIPTPHINAKENDFSKIVLMPGDPLRAKFIADNFLSNVKQINSVRGMLGFTGEYNNIKISVMGHGMGNPSIGIYSYELFAFYNVDTIIRIGSCGTFDKDVNLGDVIITKNAISNSCYAQSMNVKLDSPFTIKNNNQKLIDKAIEVANEKNIKYHLTNVLSSDAFYGETNGYEIDEMIKNNEIGAVEMEAFALYTNAKKLNKNALTILTVSDSIVTKQEMSSEQRQVGFKNMIELALSLATKL